MATLGAGTWTIDVGTGNDTVYSDNSGDNAVWVFNTDNSVAATAVAARDIDDLRSDANDTYGSLFKSTLTVTFRGVTSEVTLDATVDTDLDINQVIKAAINSDPVLSKLLVALDGPANTLVVQSLIDGAVLANDLAVNITAPTAAAFDQTALAEYATALGLPLAGLSAAGLQALVAANVAAFNATGDYTSNFANFGVVGTELTGSNSAQISQSEIRVDLDGTDVIVLSTGANSAETVVLQGVQDEQPLVVLNFGANDQFVWFDGTAEKATQLVGKEVQAQNAEGVWETVAVVDLGNAVLPVDPTDPTDPTDPADPVDVVLVDLQTVDASTGAFNFVLNYTTAGVKLATINGFGDDDTIEIVGAPAGSELQLASSSADSLDFVYGATDFSNVWGVTLGQLDAALVTDVVAAPDLAAQVGVLDTAWNEWLLVA